MKGSLAQFVQSILKQFGWVAGSNVYLTTFGSNPAIPTLQIRDLQYFILFIVFFHPLLLQSINYFLKNEKIEIIGGRLNDTIIPKVPAPGDDRYQGNCP